MNAFKVIILGLLQNRAGRRLECQEERGMSRSGGRFAVSRVIAAVFVMALSAPVAVAGTITKTPAWANSGSAAATAVAPTAFETATLKLINTYRTQRGLRALVVHEKLYLLSKQHSRNMAATNRLSHDGFYDRYRLSGFGSCVENVAWNYPTAALLVGGWKASPGHNANLLNSRIRYAGMTRVGAYATFFACG
jgi:uncharacterized protein YkwD